MKHFLLVVFLFAGLQENFAQYTRYVIQLKDKTGTPFSITDPSKFLSPRAIERRTRYNIPVDESDLPVTPAYLDSIRLAGQVTILNTSKWMNQVCIRTTDAAALEKINGFSFVIQSAPIGAKIGFSPAAINKLLDAPSGRIPTIAARPLTPTDLYNYGNAYPQISLHQAEFLHNRGFQGNDMHLAIMDAGFFHYKTLPTFDSIRLGNQITDTWDFVANEASVDEDYVHGMACLSTIAANLPGSFIGSAPKSFFYLYRTEDVSGESPVEEQNWVSAAERADSIGVNVFSVSLGYNLFDNSVFNHSYADMDGNTTIIARAADMAAKKGILVVTAVGNAGNSSWKYLTTPADADSVLAVGAVNSSRQVAGFSSYGPSSDGQVKPDIAAIGQGAVIADQNTGAPSLGNGTSYACPIMAGIVTCLWQAFPEVNNMSIIDAVRQSADKVSTPDNRLGYGIPDAKKAFVLLLKKLYSQQIVLEDTCKTRIHFSVKTGSDMKIVVERKLPSDAAYTAITTLSNNGSFASRDFDYVDNLSVFTPGVTVQYRLQMVIGTDTSFYLDSATINYERGCSNVSVNESISFSPNPVTDQLNVLIVRNSPVKAAIVVYAVSGQKVYSKEQTVSGAQRLTIPMKRMSKGLYLVTVFINDKKELVKKILRQ